MIIVLAVVLLAGAGGALYYGYWFALKKAWIRYNEFDIRSAGILQVGDLAPDLELVAADKGVRSKLSEYYQDRSLVLIFGSYT